MYMHDLQKAVRGEAVGEVTQPLTGIGTIRSATPTKITFLAIQQCRSDLSQSRAGAIISAMTLVSKSPAEPGTYTGSMPLMRPADWLSYAVHLRRLAALADAVKGKPDVH